MVLVALTPGEMPRDISGIRPKGFTLRPGSWTEVTKAEADALMADPLLAPRLVLMETPEAAPAPAPSKKTKKLKR